MSIMIGCPVNNRAKILPQYLSHIFDLEFPKDIIHLSFVVNGPQNDSTYELLLEFKKKFQKLYKDITIVNIHNEYTDSRNVGRNYSNIANMRNTWLSTRTKEDEYIFSVDSDILISDWTLMRLISHKKDICSALVKNLDMGPIRVYNIRGDPNDGFDIIEPTGKLLEVYLTGACYLIHKNVIDSGVAYGYHEWGEDVIFCNEAKRRGFGIFCDTGLTTEHIMEI